MSHEDFGKLTLGDIEAIAARLEAAAKVFREARALLSGGAATVPMASGAGVQQTGPSSAPSLSAVEQERRAALLGQFPRDVLEAASRG